MPTKTLTPGTPRPLDEMKLGDLGLVFFRDSAEKPALVVPFSVGETKLAMVLPPDPFQVNGRTTRSIVLDKSNFDHWPDILVLNDPVVVPDLSSMHSSYEAALFGLTIAESGDLILSGRDHTIYGARFQVNLSSPEPYDLKPRSSYWAFKRWSVGIDQLTKGSTLRTVFSYDISSADE